jgi:hypothetical protein
VETAEQNAHIEEVIRQVEGVQFIKNRVHVEAVEDATGKEEWRHPDHH